MDTSDPDIVFDENGVCNHCRQYEKLVAQYVSTGDAGKRQLTALSARVKKAERGKTYDCVLGVSGGIDSTYVAYLARELALKPYLVALDNGYDTLPARRNALRIADYLGTELHAHRIDPREFRDLQMAYLKSGVLNIEVLTDHAIRALLYRTAAKLGVKYVLSGTNIVTEGILPPAWGGYNSSADLRNIVDIYRNHGSGLSLSTFPQISISETIHYHWMRGIRFVSPLNYVLYDKQAAKDLFAKEFGYEDYGPKHCESVFTRFYQFYILPRRLGVDKRRAHLACLVMSQQMTREEALAELATPPYTAEQFACDRKYVADYLAISEDELEALVALPIRSATDYATGRTGLRVVAVVTNPRAVVQWIARSVAAR